MPINISVSPRINPRDKDAAPKFYGKVQTSGTVSFDSLAEDIAYATTLTDGDVSNVLRALVKQIKKHLADGKIVNLDGLGTFQFQISGKGAATEKDYSSALIKKVRIQYRPGRLVREVQNLTTLQFKKVALLRTKSSDDGVEDEVVEEN